MATRILTTKFSRHTTPRAGSLAAVPPTAVPAEPAATEPVCCIGARIGALRRRRRLTQEQLAARIGRSVDAVSALERGRNKPTHDTLGRLAEALGVPVRDFFPPAGGDAESPRQAALFSELLYDARTLPPADLELAANMVGLLAKRRGG